MRAKQSQSWVMEIASGWEDHPALAVTYEEFVIASERFLRAKQSQSWVMEIASGWEDHTVLAVTYEEFVIASERFLRAKQSQSWVMEIASGWEDHPALAMTSEEFVIASERFLRAKKSQSWVMEIASGWEDHTVLAMTSEQTTIRVKYQKIGKQNDRSIEMRIAIIASGSRGDVQPYIALGKGLQNSGHEIRLITHRDFESLVTAHGLELWADEINLQSIAQSEVMRELIEKGNFIKMMARMAKEAERESVQFARVGLAACQGVDAILVGLGGLHIAIGLAEKLNLPLIQAYLFPFTPTGEFASVLTPALPSWTGASMRRLSHQLTRQMMWQGLRPADKATRRDVLGLAGAPFAGPFRSARLKGMPVLYGYSPAILPKPADWGEEVHVTGYWYLEAADNWTPSPELAHFLEAGPAPVYIGFGSLSARNPQETTNLVLQALERTGQRAILMSGWGGLQATDLPETALMIESVPHDWLFPRMAAVVHHGGAGTTSASLRAGVPTVVVPFFGDQPFWGRKLAELGVGPAPIPRKKLTAERLAQAIRVAGTDAGMRRRAAEIGEIVRAEDGLAAAAAVIRQVELQAS